SFIKKNDYSILIPTLFIDGKSTIITLDTRFFSGKPKKKFRNNKFVCRFRHQLLVDIQTKIASHVSRLGINNFGQ
ncbi:hypothetical protein OAA06_02400, partial [bacterium]|nr:hypothetical protein [bacterium]